MLKITQQQPKIINIFDAEKEPPHNHTLSAICIGPSEILKPNKTILINGSEFLAKTLQAYTKRAPPAIVFTAKDISIAGHGLMIDSVGQRISSHGGITETGRMDHPFNAKLMSMKKDDYISGTNIVHRHIEIGDFAILSQAGQGVYGHWLIDILPRLALIEAMGFNGKYVFHEPIPDFGHELLKIFQLQKNRILTFDPNREFLSFKQALVPSSLRSGNAFSKLNHLARLRLTKNQNTALDKKIYISRSDLTSNNQTITNRVLLETIAIKHGFKVVHPEKLTLSEQINIFSSAKTLAGEYGSGMHNSIFANEECKILVFQSDSHPFFNQAGLSGYTGQPTFISFGSSIGKNRDFSISSETANHAFDLVG